MTEMNKVNRFASLKTEYIIKTFTRTTNKQFENYVVNAIWNRLGRFDLRPVTQQYVKLKNGKYALMDLYFPQIKVGIECDESYHTDNIENDDVREKSINDVLNSIDETSGFEMMRVKAFKSIEEIDREIDEIVIKLRKKLDGDIKPWKIIDKPAEMVLENGKISTDDALEFKTIQELCRCFGRDDKPIQRCYFDIGNGYQIWCPKLAVYEENRPKAGSAAGWINELSEDKEFIYESNPENDDADHRPQTQNKPRIAFAKSKSVLGIDAYRFLGVYQYQQNHEKTTITTRVYRRISKEMDVNTFKKPKE